MKRTRHTAEQIIRKRKTAEQLIAQGKTVADVCRNLEVTQPTDHRWRQQYGGMQAEEARRLTQLVKENARPKKLLAEAELEKAMLRNRFREIAVEHIRWGRLMAYRLLRREEGLQRATSRKRKRAWPNGSSVRRHRHRAEHLHQVWAMDFQFDATPPSFIRSDNGPDFIAQSLRSCRETSGTTTASIEQGSPWENGFAESFNGRFRDEFLNTELFITAPGAQILADRWRWESNTVQAALGPPGAYAPGGSSTGSCSIPRPLLA
jgi:transposase InsO family protein